MNESHCTKNKEERHLRPAWALNVLGIGVMSKEECLIQPVFASGIFCPHSAKGEGGRRKGKVLREGKTILIEYLRGFYFKMISSKLRTLSLNLGEKQLFLC